MVTQPAYLKNLKTFMRAQLGIDTQPRLAVQNIVGESDRGAVILAATSVEDMLEWAILARMPGLLKDPGARESIFGVNGSVGTFSNKIAMAYAMGIIEKDARREIDLIREMRNACAHARQPVSFSTPEIRDVCKQVIPEVIPHIADPNDGDALRLCFTLKCVLYCQLLAGGPEPDLVGELKARIQADALKSSPQK
jgi:hypothetical protein